jgi:gliding motility-associated-like protein
VRPAGCTTRAVFTITNFYNGLWNSRIYQGTTLLKNITTLAAVVTDSLFPGTYTLRTSNGTNNCFRDTVVIITSATTTQLSLAIDKPSCNKFADGAIAVTATNGHPPYVYTWGTNPYVSSNTFTNLNSGTYTIYVKDSEGCVKDTTLLLADSLKVNGSVVKTDVACFGENTGSMTVNVNGGNGGYKYALNTNPLGTTNVFTDLTVNTYTIHTEDMLGCYWDTSVIVSEPAPLTFIPTLTNLTCNGDLSGVISIAGNGGTSPYLYNLNNAGYVPTPAFTGLASGQYIIDVKDDHGCLETDTVILSEPPAIKIAYLNLVNPRCFGTDGGFVIITANGGTPPLVYSANQQTYIANSTVTGLTAGQHILHIKDNVGCVKDSLITLTQPPAIEASTNIKQATCSPLKNGSITLTAQGGTPGYQYAIDSGKYSEVNTFKNLPSGTYTMRIMDNLGCKKDEAVTVTDSLRVSPGVAISNITCYGLANGEIVVTPAGGIDPYTMALDKRDYQDSFRFTGLSNTTYTLHVKDSIGCMADTNLTITRPDRITLVPAITNSSCYTGLPDGKIALEVRGGTAPYTYLWSNKTSTNVITGLGTGNYFVWVTDANNCKDSLQSTVEYADCCTPFVPTAFTPNGDGRNDLFHVKVKGDMKLIAFKVFNRFGQMVYTGEDVEAGWDGTVNGTAQEIGTYYYFIKATCGFNNEHPVNIKGDVTLIR